MCCGAAVTSAAEVHSLLRRAGTTVATAESLTGGLLAAELSAVPGASATFRGGLVVYATDLKASLGGVDATLLAARGPVCAPVAVALATGVARQLGAGLGVATTGVAGPEKQNGIAVGTVYVAVAWPSGAVPDRPVAGASCTRSAAGELVARLDLVGDRQQVRATTVSAALAAMALVLHR